MLCYPVKEKKKAESSSELCHLYTATF